MSFRLRRRCAALVCMAISGASSGGRASAYGTTRRGSAFVAPLILAVEKESRNAGGRAGLSPHRVQIRSAPTLPRARGFVCRGFVCRSRAWPGGRARAVCSQPPAAATPCRPVAGGTWRALRPAPHRDQPARARWPRTPPVDDRAHRTGAEGRSRKPPRRHQLITKSRHQPKVERRGGQPHGGSNPAAQAARSDATADSFVRTTTEKDRPNR